MRGIADLLEAVSVTDVGDNILILENNPEAPYAHMILKTADGVIQLNANINTVAQFREWVIIALQMLENNSAKFEPLQRVSFPPLSKPLLSNI